MPATLILADHLRKLFLRQETRKRMMFHRRWVGGLRAVGARLVQRHKRPKQESVSPPDPESGLHLEWLEAGDYSTKVISQIVTFFGAFLVIGPCFLVLAGLLIKTALNHRHDPLSHAIPIGLGCALGGGFLVVVWLILTLGPLWLWGVMRFPLRLRSALFGAFPQRAQHMILHTSLLVVCLGVVTYLVLCASWAPAPDSLVSLSGVVRINLIVTCLAVAWSAIHSGLRERPRRGPRVSVSDPSRLPPHSQSPGAIRIAHWSDLHLVGVPGRQRIEKRRLLSRSRDGAGGDEVLHELITRHGPSLLADVAVIIASGDITDSGQMVEWKAFFRLVTPALLDKLILVPGNHDINIGSSLSNLFEPQDRLVRLIRFLVAANRVQGQRSFFLQHGQLRTLRSYLLEEASALDDLLDLRRRSGLRKLTQAELKHQEEVDWRTRAVWNTVFPMAVTFDGSPLVFIVIDSVDPSTNALTNAFGNVGKDQRERIEKIVAQFPNHPKVVILHHHLLGAIEMPDGKPVKMSERGMGILDAEPLSKILAKDVGVLFNGHRHIEYMAQLDDDLMVISAPSTTLGNECPGRERKMGGFRTFGIAWEDGRAKVVTSEWMGLEHPHT
jgi:3',5'-cyclic AMP phosphodiesterase CpdA